MRRNRNTVREELAKYLGVRTCPDCGGARLTGAAQFVFVGDQSLPEVTRLSVGHALTLYRSLTLEGWRAEVATPIVKEVVQRLRFLADVGLQYLTLDRGADTL